MFQDWSGLEKYSFIEGMLCWFLSKHL
ncbi:unnamed protein product [Acanthoscelides obtectus]|uniref:Uncharacterized protein n=1 Tax=Acanthoscelides obtectus TaxID=200917 RepID=A0A9P0KJ97_ACAOB|nr:unnamed protein product [Acanthoscelides obtectus]CAK1655801.1 hypothetical protein AOBTE_LOCUS19348 [Acanthoscelides obtectus]